MILRGKCGLYEGQEIGKGATTELTRMLNFTKPSYACNNSRIYFTDEETIEKSCLNNGDDENLSDPNSPCGFRIFWDHKYQYEGSHCLSPEEMNYYYDQARGIANEYKPTGKVLIEYYVYWDIVSSVPEFMTFHTLGLKYAKPNCTGTLPKIF